MSLPALQFLCSQSSQHAEAWVSTACVPLVQFANRVRAIPSTGLDLLELGLEGPARSELARFDSIVSWYGSEREEFRAAVRNFPVTFHRALPVEDCGLSAVDWYLQQVGGPAGAVPIVSAESLEMRNFVACQPFSGSAQKNWSLAKFRALADSLDIPMEFCVGPEEEMHEARQFTSLNEVAAWLASARAYVGNDSGVSHLAAAVGVPVLAIFRCTEASVWTPRGLGPVRVLQGDPAVCEVRDALVELWRRP